MPAAPRRRSPRALGLIALLFAVTPGFAATGSASSGAEWPEFRGPTGQGHADAAGLPVEWSTTQGVQWKQAVPGAGWSSPVVGGGRIFLTTGVEQPNGALSLRALAFDAATGQPVWEREVFVVSDARATPQHPKNSPASPTPILAGDRLFVHFGPHGTAALDRDGQILWRNASIAYDPVHGNGGSPALSGPHLVFSADGAADPFVVALDQRTGEIAWKSPRSVVARQPFSFSTPLVITVAGRPQIVIPGSGAVSGLEPETGRERWHVRYGQGYSVVPRPVFAHGLVFVATGYNRAEMIALRPDGEGDLTDTHIAWRTVKGAPLTPSLLVVGDELYGVADMGVASCWDARTGALHWQERIEGNYSASPLAAGGRIYFLNEQGTSTVIQAGKTFVKLATNRLEERTLASFGVVGDSLLIRTATQLYRIGK